MKYLEEVEENVAMIKLFIFGLFVLLSNNIPDICELVLSRKWPDIR